MKSTGSGQRPKRLAHPAVDSVKLKDVSTSPTTSAEADKDVTRSGQLIGFDVLHFSVNPVTGRTTIRGSVDVRDGLIYGALTSSITSSVATGRVTGGTGAFRHATGRIVARAVTNSKTVVTIVYTP